MPVLEVNDLSVAFAQYESGLRRKELTVISGLNVSVGSGEILAVVGASGSGKSLLAHAILGILPGNARLAGTIRYRGETLTPARQAELRGAELALVPQAVTFLDPLMRVGRQVRLAARGSDPTAAQRAVFARYNLPPAVEKLYPFELSGGMARRVLVSTAVVSGAQVVIADEPTPGLDEAALRETLGFFREMADAGRAVMLITHDIEAALRVADRIAVFYAGTTIEVARAEDFADTGESLRHPYSQALWRALPRNGFIPLAGFQPANCNLVAGCPFQPRCPRAATECAKAEPPPRVLRGGMVRCHYAS